MTPALRALEAAGIAFDVCEYTHRSDDRPDYGREAAAELGLSEHEVFKTLLVSTETGELVVAVVPVSCRLSMKAVAAAAGTKRVTMCDPAAAERSTGYVVGGISPIGQRKRLRTLIDESAVRLDIMYVSGGRRGLDIGLAPAELVALLDADLAALIA
ncbi:MAG: Cys-tRNA(Pro) deacylase [Ilumatobacter sp.]|nr:Cys-tRNA(Pro) deacylase [Ilumatobacter sp.]